MAAIKKIQIHNLPPELENLRENYFRMLRWICRHLGFFLRYIVIIFVTDRKLAVMHKKYFNDSSVTDVITFNLSDDSAIEAEIYISVGRIREQSQQLGVPISEEAARMMIHGCLHLAGFDDRNSEDRDLMKKEETEMIQIAMQKYLLQSGNNSPAIKNNVS